MISWTGGGILLSFILQAIAGDNDDEIMQMGGQI